MIFSYRIRHFELQPEMLYYQRKKGWEKNPWVHNDMWNIKILKIAYFFTKLDVKHPAWWKELRGECSGWQIFLENDTVDLKKGKKIYID